MIVSIGLLKMVKARWAFLPMSFCFYHMKKTIEDGNVKINRQAVLFQSKFEQAVAMVAKISAAFADTPILIVTDSWFGNNGLFKPLRKTIGQHCHDSLLGCVLTLICLIYRVSRRNINGGVPKNMVKNGAVRQHSLSDSSIWLRPIRINLYGKDREVLAYDQILMLKTLKVRCPGRLGLSKIKLDCTLYHRP